MISYIEVPFKASLTVSGFKSFCLVLTVYTIDTFTNRDSLIDKNDCYVCMYCYRFYSLLVVTVYMLNTFTNCDSLIDKNDCYVCM